MIRALLLAIALLVNATVAHCEEIRVVTEPWPPYTYSENGTIKGVVTEIVEETLRRSGLDYSIEMYPWARAYDIARNNKNVLIYSILKLPSREAHFKWIQIDGLQTNMFLFSPKHRGDINICTLDEAKNYRIGVTRETSTHHFLLSKGFVEGINLFPVNSEGQNILKSSPQAKRIDLTTGDRLSLAHNLIEAGLPPDYWEAEVLLFQKDFYMAFGFKTSDEVVEKIRKGFREMKEEGVLKAIVKKYSQFYE